MGDAQLMRSCVYSIRHSGQLRRWHIEGGRGEFTINQSWTAANSLVQKAAQSGCSLPILFAPAEDTRFIFGWGEIEALNRIAGHTTVEIKNFKSIATKLRKTSLKLRSGKNVDGMFRRPYAICQTPSDLTRLPTREIVTRMGEEEGIPEGNVLKVVVNRHERSSHARSECIRTHGFRCAACEMSFFDCYGDEAADLIHVHHLDPLRRGARKTDPKMDLVPICPNCHAVIHLRKPPFCIHDVRRMLSNRSKSGIGDVD